MGQWDDLFVETPEPFNEEDKDNVESFKVKVKKESEKAWLVQFEVNPKAKWVPKSKCTLNKKTGELQVPQWLLDKWEEDDNFQPDIAEEGESVSFPGCVCLRETEAALQVEVQGLGEVWFPKSHILDKSEVKGDADVGTLIVTKWIAEQKSLAGDKVMRNAEETPNIQDDLEQEN